MKTYRDLPGHGGSDVLGQVMAQRRAVSERLADVRATLAVMSGKGGVGKSTVTVGLAAALAQRGRRVAILDADLNGPSIPRMLGLRRALPALHADGIEPVLAALGIAVMSTDLFLADDGEPLRFEGPHADPYTWRPTAEATTFRELLGNTRWGQRDWLLLDLPPGADRLPALVSLVPNLAGAVAVTLASPVSLAAVRRSVATARDCGVRVLGLVENMAGHRCGGCGELTPLFGDAGAVERAAADLELPFLGAVPFDARLADALERGEAPFGGEPLGDGPLADEVARAHADAASRIEALVGHVAAVP